MVSQAEAPKPDPAGSWECLVAEGSHGNTQHLQMMESRAVFSCNIEGYL